MLLRRFAASMADAASAGRVAAGSAGGPVASAIHAKLHAALQPASFKLVNDSHKHAGHWVDDGSAASAAKETHFRLEVVSDAFAGLAPVKRHQLIYGLLKDELAAGLHALSMSLKTPAEADLPSIKGS